MTAARALPTRLDPADHVWMRDPATQAVMDALEAARPGGSRYVGGCIRNALLGKPVADVDIATQLLPEQVVEAARAAGLKPVPTGIRHGTVSIISAGRPFEVTTLRRDVETDGRRAVVAFTEDWDEDARRRDFRLNALYADRNGIIHDPTGGLADLDPCRFVFVGSAENRIREDYLRTLRLFRFEAWYGAGAPAPEGVEAAARLKQGLHTLSAERVWSELKKLLAAPDPGPAIAVMAEHGILSEILGVNGSLESLEVL